MDEKKKQKENCLLEKSKCNGYCTHCGWDRYNAKGRMRQLAENGLTLCKDGTFRLIIKRKGAIQHETGKG